MASFIFRVSLSLENMQFPLQRTESFEDNRIVSDALEIGKKSESPYRDQTPVIQQRTAYTIFEYLTAQTIPSA
jgi:hypothetical protein